MRVTRYFNRPTVDDFQKEPVQIFQSDKPKTNRLSIFLEKPNINPFLAYGPIYQSAFIHGVILRLASKPIERDIDLEAWKTALSYNDDETKTLAGTLLKEFNIPVTDANLVWLYKSAEDLLSEYEKEYGVQLTTDDKKIMRNLILKMTYDKLRMPKSAFGESISLNSTLIVSPEDLLIAE
jgi:hypothetical protein